MGYSPQGHKESDTTEWLALSHCGILPRNPPPIWAATSHWVELSVLNNAFLLVIHFKYSSVYMTIPNSLTSPFPHPSPQQLHICSLSVSPRGFVFFFFLITIKPKEATGGSAVRKGFGGIPWALLVLATAQGFTCRPCRKCLIVTGKPRAEDSFRNVWTNIRQHFESISHLGNSLWPLASSFSGIGSKYTPVGSRWEMQFPLCGVFALCFLGLVC